MVGAVLLHDRVKSIAEIRDAQNTIVGWIYLGTSANEYAQANEMMRDPDLRVLHLQREGTDPSSIAPIDAPFAPRGLHVIPCTSAEQKITD